MQNNSESLYKLMILYILNKVDFPLSNSQITDFMLGKEYTNYFTLQQSLHSMEDDDFISAISHNNNTHYVITERGSETINFFKNKIPQAICDEIDSYLSDNKYELKCETQILSDYHSDGRGSFIARLRIIENSITLIDLCLNVPTQEEARNICSNWKTNNRAVYGSIMRHLL